MRTSLVIGSNCFTGSHMVDALLAAGDTVVGVSRSAEKDPLYLPYRRHADLARRFRFVRLDSVKQHDELVRLLDEVAPQVVINVAALSEVAQSNHTPVEYFDINTTAVVKLANVLRTRRWLQRFVHVSSAEIFGSCPAPVDEQAPFRPSTPYAVSKAAADLYLDTLRKNFDFRTLIVRSTNVYGRHQQLFKIIPRTVIRARRGEVVELHGGGTAAKCFVHVRDVVDGMMLALGEDAAGVFHFSVPSDLTVADVVRMTCELMGKDPREVVRPVGERLGQDARYVLDVRKARDQLGWQARVTLEQGIRETIEWIDGNWAQIQREPMAYEHRV